MTIKELLKIRGNKQIVHKKTGLSIQALYKIQTGQSVPKTTTHYKICKSLKITPSTVYRADIKEFNKCQQS